MSKPPKTAGKTPGGAAALRARVTPSARAAADLERLTAERDHMTDKATELHGQVRRAAISLQDLDNETDIACADMQALSRAAALLMVARTDCETSDHSHRQAAAVILEQLLPSMAARLSRRVSRACGDNGVPTIPTADRECVHRTERQPPEQGLT